jgi:Bacterial regulatory proteins, gntR family
VALTRRVASLIATNLLLPGHERPSRIGRPPWQPLGSYQGGRRGARPCGLWPPAPGVSPGAPLPSIRTLQQTYGVSDGTVKKAVQVLRDEGLVRTVRGRGVYVSPSPQGTG